MQLSMNYRMVIKSLLVWALIIPCAILNGAFRQMILEPRLGNMTANAISVVMLCLLIFIVAFFFIPRLGRGNRKTYLKIGLLWILATVVFETGLGLLLGMSLQEVLEAYNIMAGNFWLVVVLFTGIAPILTAKLKRIV